MKTDTIQPVAAQPSPMSTIPDLVRAHDAKAGPISITMSASIPSLSLEHVAQNADLVIEATAVASSPGLSPDQQYILTTHVIRVERPLLIRGGVPPADRVSVTQVGERGHFDGTTVICLNSSAPLFALNDHLILFLEG